MNNDRRKSIDAAIKSVEELKDTFDKLASAFEDARAVATELKEQVESIRDEEQEYYDNMPESLQSGEKGCSAESAVFALDEAISSLEELGDLDDLEITDIDSIITQLDDAKHQ